jgi:putative membrane protein
MRTLVLCIDRDNDIGVKAGIPGPIIGRRDNLDAAMKLGLADPEDADVNTMLTAISRYDDLIRSGIDADIATLSGDMKVGERSDREIVRQLEEVIDEVRPDTAYLISDGAEDESVFPLITSRLKVDHVRRVFVKQQTSIESAVSIVAKTLRDEKWRRRLFTPLGLVLLLWGLSVFIGIIPSIMKFGWTIDVANSFPPTLILIVLGFSILYITYPGTFSLKRGLRNVRDSYDDAKSSVMSGDVRIFFTIVAWILILLGAFYGLDASAGTADYVEKFFLFVGGFIWLFIVGVYLHELGKIIVVILKKREFPKSFWPVTIFFFVLSIIMGAMLLTMSVLFGYTDPTASLPVIVITLIVAIAVLVLGTAGWRMLERKAPAEVEWRR